VRAAGARRPNRAENASRRGHETAIMMESQSQAEEGSRIREPKKTVHKSHERKVNERTCVRERTVFDLGKIQILAVRGMLGAGRQGCAAVQRGAHAALSAGFRLNRHNECMIEARMPVKS
jgi:ABC-type sugar transport system ATPase subunit